jgi:hypothetical protein
MSTAPGVNEDQGVRRSPAAGYRRTSGTKTSPARYW